MSGVLLVRGARQLLTLRGPSEPRRGSALNELAVIEDGAVLIREGVIVSVGPSRRVENLSEARQAQEIDATGRVVMPGFVDSHTHLVCGPARLTEYEMRLAGAGTREIARAGGGLAASVRAVRSASTRRLELEARRRLRNFIRHGATTVEAKSGYGLDERSELRILRATAALQDDPLTVAPTFLAGRLLPPEFASRPEEYLDWLCCRMLPLVRQRRLARFVDAYCGEAFPLEWAHRYLLRAAELGFGLKVHAAQFACDGAARLAVELGAVSADHLNYLSEEDIAALAASPTVATLLPGAVFHLGSERYPPARALIEAGAAVALATGFDPNVCPCFSMPMILALACTRMRMTPAEAITAATINGAHALGLAACVGSIEPGKLADLVIFDVPDYREIPYHFGVNLVSMVLKRGRVLFQQGKIRWEED